MPAEPFVQGSSVDTTAPAEFWRRSVENITTSARDILRNVEEARRIYRGNRIVDLITATADGAAVPGTTMSKEQAIAWAGMVEAVAAFMATEVSPGFTIEDGLYAMWPAPPTIEI